MKITKKLAARLFAHLSVVDQEAVRAPGAGIAALFPERDGRAITVVSRGDAFDVYHGRRFPITFSASPDVLWRLAVWVIWTWWVRATWCGLKPRLWAWSLDKITEPESKHDRQEAPGGVRQPGRPAAGQRTTA